MDKETYLKQKLLRPAPPVGRSLCWTCYRPTSGCLCEHIKPFDSQTRIVVLQHPREARREKLGTGRLAVASMTNAERLEGVDFTKHKRVNQLLQEPNHQAFVLYPGEEALDLSTLTPEGLSKSPLGDDKERTLFILDGTWPLAKKMMKMSPNLQALPRLSFKVKARSRFLIKQQPSEDCLASIEAIFYCLEELERLGLESFDGAHKSLMTLFDQLNQYQIDLVSDPTRKGYRIGKRYKDPSQRTTAKKWKERKLFFQEPKP